MIIQSMHVWINEKFISAQIEIEHDKIKSVNLYGNKPADFDYGDNFIIPGMIDIHTHGLCGASTSEPTVESMIYFKKLYPREGVTSFLPSVETLPLDKGKAAYKVIAEAMKNTDGAEILGSYMEGNFISKKCKGAQCEDYIVKPNIDDLHEYINASDHTLRLACIAVENDDNYEVCDFAKNNGIRISCGHSAASYEQVKESMNHGVVSITHTYNGCIQFHHREVGVIGAAMNLDNIYAEVICDGFHVSYPAISILGKLKGKDHLIMVSDANPYKDYEGSIPEGYFIDESGCFRNSSGNLCSSTMHMNKGLQNLIEKVKLPVVTSINAATINPARMLGVDDRIGSIEAGKDADIAVLDNKFDVIQTYCKGKAIKEE